MLRPLESSHSQTLIINGISIPRPILIPPPPKWLLITIILAHKPQIAAREDGGVERVSFASVDLFLQLLYGGRGSDVYFFDGQNILLKVTIAILTRIYFGPANQVIVCIATAYGSQIVLGGLAILLKMHICIKINIFQNQFFALIKRRTLVFYWVGQWRPRMESCAPILHHPIIIGTLRPLHLVLSFD